MDRINVLRAFTRLVEVGSFTAVADELRVKQSTVSKWLAQLEDELGVVLVDRTTRAQRVTDAGQRFYERARGVLAAWDEAVGELRAEGDDPLRGRVRLSLPVVFGRLFVVPLVVDLLEAHPELEVEMVFGDRYVRLVDEGFDCAIRVGVPVDSSLRAHVLGASDRRLVASPDYLAAHGRPRAPRDLEAHQCLLHDALGPAVVWSFRQGDQTRRASVRGRVAANHSEATQEMARRGLGVCLLASWLVDPDIAAGRLEPLLEDWAAPRASIQALTPPGRHVAAPVRGLIDHLRAGLAPVLGKD